MNNLELVPDTENTHTVGRFGTRFSGRQLFLSPAVFALLPPEESAKTLSGFLNLIHAFPGIFVEKFRWNLDDVKRAKDHFLQQLETHAGFTEPR